MICLSFLCVGIEFQAMLLPTRLLFIVVGSAALGLTLTRDEVESVTGTDQGSKLELQKPFGGISAGNTSRDLEKDDFKVIRGELKVRVRRSSVVDENSNEEDDLDEFFENSMQRQDRDSVDFDSTDDNQESYERTARGGGGGGGEDESWQRKVRSQNRKENSTASGLENEEESGYGKMNSSSIPSDLNKFVRRMHDPQTAREFFHEYARLANFPRETIGWDEPHLVYSCWVHAMLSGRFPYSPSCDSEGQFTTKQCFLERCWCVHPDTGKPVVTNRGERFYYKMAAVNLVCKVPTRPPHTTSPSPASNFTYFHLNQTSADEDKDWQPRKANTSATYISTTALNSPTTPKT